LDVMQSVQAQQQIAELGTLGGFDQALVFEEADLDFLDEHVGYLNDEGLPYLDSCGVASPRWDNTPASSFETHSPQHLLLADQPRLQPLLQDAKQRTKELNRRHQKRFREKQKVTVGLVGMLAQLPNWNLRHCCRHNTNEIFHVL